MTRDESSQGRNGKQKEMTVRDLISAVHHFGLTSKKFLDSDKDDASNFEE